MEKTLTDVETSFIYGLLCGVMFMTCPPGYGIIRNEMKQNQKYKDNMKGDTCRGRFAQLEKTIYGLVQAARAW